MKEFMTIRYCVDELRRQAREQKYLKCADDWQRSWFKDVDIEVEESTKTLIQNIFKGTK
jgi:hypothetical protein